MSFDVPPLTRFFAAPSVDRSGSAAARTGARFSDTIDGVTPPIPDEVWDQVDAAARLAEQLHTEGRGVRFDVHKLDGDVVASLVDEDGALLRPLLLTDVVDVDKLAHELSKDQS